MDEIVKAVKSCTKIVNSKSYTKHEIERAIITLDKYLERNEVKNHPMYDVIVLCVSSAQRELREKIMCNEQDTKEARDAAERLKYYCIGRGCSNCIFMMAKHGNCILKDRVPGDWDLTGIGGDE